MSRALRVREGNDQFRSVQAIATEENEAEREVRAGITAVVDRLCKVSEKLSEKSAEFKRETADLERQKKVLTEQIRKYSQSRNISVIEGQEAVAEVNPSVSRTIEPELFLRFLREQGQISAFFAFVKVNIGEATRAYGEKVLEQSGCLEVSTRDYRNVKVSPKVPLH